jgi:hypothetical protein
MSKTVFGKFFSFVKKLFTSLDSEMKKAIPVVISVVNTVKGFIDSPASDVLFELSKMPIPGTADDILIDKVHSAAHKALPKLLLNLTIIDTINKISDPKERAEMLANELTNAIHDLKFASDEKRNMFIRGLAQMIIMAVSDGRVTWIEAANIGEYGYRYLSDEKAN